MNSTVKTVTTEHEGLGSARLIFHHVCFIVFLSFLRLLHWYTFRWWSGAPPSINAQCTMTVLRPPERLSCVYSEAVQWFEYFYIQLKLPNSLSGSSFMRNGISFKASHVLFRFLTLPSAGVFLQGLCLWCLFSLFMVSEHVTSNASDSESSYRKCVFPFISFHHVLIEFIPLNFLSLSV